MATPPTVFKPSWHYKLTWAATLALTLSATLVATFTYTRIQQVAGTIHNGDTYVVGDQRWRSYVSELSPVDASGAFLTPEELPSPTDTSEYVTLRIRSATQRAFPTGKLVAIKDFVPGFLNGTAYILTPQGSRHSIPFAKDEAGWKATAEFDIDGEAARVSIYYRAKCMNPIVSAAKITAQDMTAVEFTSAATKAKEKAEFNTRLEQLLSAGMERLKREYESRRSMTMYGVQVNFSPKGDTITIQWPNGATQSLSAPNK